MKNYTGGIPWVSSDQRFHCQSLGLTPGLGELRSHKLCSVDPPLPHIASGGCCEVVTLLLRGGPVVGQQP